MTRKRTDYVGATITREQQDLIVQAIVRLAHSLGQGHSGSIAECSACKTLAVTVTREYAIFDEDDDE